MFLLENYPRLAKFVVNTKTQTFCVVRAQQILDSTDDSVWGAKESILAVCLEIWTDGDGPSLEIFREVMDTDDFHPVCSGIKYYLTF